MRRDARRPDRDEPARATRIRSGKGDPIAKPLPRALSALQAACCATIGLNKIEDRSGQSAKPRHVAAARSTARRAAKKQAWNILLRSGFGTVVGEANVRGRERRKGFQYQFWAAASGGARRRSPCARARSHRPASRKKLSQCGLAADGTNKPYRCVLRGAERRAPAGDGPALLRPSACGRRGPPGHCARVTWTEKRQEG